MTESTGTWMAEQVRHDRSQGFIRMESDAMEVFGAYLGRLMMTEELWEEVPYRRFRIFVNGQRVHNNWPGPVLPESLAMGGQGMSKRFGGKHHRKIPPMRRRISQGPKVSQGATKPVWYNDWPDRIFEGDLPDSLMSDNEMEDDEESDSGQEDVEMANVDSLYMFEMDDV